MLPLSSKLYHRSTPAQLPPVADQGIMLIALPESQPNPVA